MSKKIISRLEFVALDPGALEIRVVEFDKKLISSSTYTVEVGITLPSGN